MPDNVTLHVIITIMNAFTLTHLKISPIKISFGRYPNSIVQ